MEVHEHTGTQTRQHVEHDEVDVAAELDGVGAVDKQHVAFTQRFELLEWHIGGRDGVDTRRLGQLTEYVRARVRVKRVVDGGHPVTRVSPAGEVDQERAVTGAELDHASRPHRTDDPVQQLRVDSVEGIVAEMELAGNVVGVA